MLRAELGALAESAVGRRALLVLGSTILSLADVELFVALEAAAEARRAEIKNELAEAKRLAKEAEVEAKAREADAKRQAKLEELEEKKRIREEERLARLEEKKRKREEEAALKKEAKEREVSTSAKRGARLGAAARKGLHVGTRVEGPLWGADEYEGSWYEGTLLDIPEKGRALVRFDLLPADADDRQVQQAISEMDSSNPVGSQASEAIEGETKPSTGSASEVDEVLSSGRSELSLVPLDSLRPLPPARPPALVLERRLRNGWGMPVELFFEGGWWEAELLGGAGGAWAVAERGSTSAAARESREGLVVGARVMAVKAESDAYGKSGTVVHIGNTGVCSRRLRARASLKPARPLASPAHVITRHLLLCCCSQVGFVFNLTRVVRPRASARPSLRSWIRVKPR